MSNMSYCRFHNTLSDLQDCQFALQELAEGSGKLSSEERRAAELLVSYCKEIAEAFTTEKGEVQIPEDGEED